MKLCAAQPLLVVSFAVVPTAADNMVINPGFESGLTGWTASPDWGSGNFAVHSGSLESGSKVMVRHLDPMNCRRSRMEPLFSGLVNESNNDGVYQQVFTTFTASGTTTRLQFDGRNDLSFLIIDDVCVDAPGGACVQASTVPEPAQGFLILAAFAIAFLARKYRLV